MATEEADIDRILKEKGKGAKKKYLCSWLDGAPAQWLDAKHLKGTVALDEWEDYAPDIEEVQESEEAIARKCETLAQWFVKAKRPTLMVGAGISASVLPTFRGKGGFWTRNPKKREQQDPTNLPAATDAHKAVTALAHAGYWYHVGSQNYDDIFGRCGFPAEHLSELHGNLFTEVCRTCGATYHRNFEVAQDSAVDHETGRKCEDSDCGGDLFDNIIHFDEDMPWKELTLCNAKFLGSDLSIAIGTSLRVNPAAAMPFKAKERRGRYSANPPKSVIVNLQPTPRDSDADMVLRATCDRVCNTLAERVFGKETWANALATEEWRELGQKHKEAQEAARVAKAAERKKNRAAKRAAKLEAEPVSGGVQDVKPPIAKKGKKGKKGKST
eukprot:m.61499 g.61499  ORF g.61499 m.61499 type:complete len:385 (+) comp11868_c1_seq1:82-1236(+)